MLNSLRKEVLQGFKLLHRTRQSVFNGDEKLLKASRIKINEEYKKCKGVTDEYSIKELIVYSKAVEKELRTTVIQAVHVKPGVYRANIKEETVKLDNVPYKECSNKS